MQPAPERRVVVVDDDTLIREGAAKLFSRVRVAGTYMSAERLLDDRPSCDVVVLDLNLNGIGGTRNGLNGAAAVRAISAAGYRVLLYTNEHRLLVLARCYSAGAFGLVHKSEPISHIEAAIEEVARGAKVLSVALAGLAEAIRASGHMRELSTRQREVLSARARGEPFKSIAKRLNISERTAQDYMNRVSLAFSDYLTNHSAADLERHLGVGPGDLLDG
ncbi:response regulator transcription factor [Blastococcus sp. Marseille-P5729]|uniref:response regulator transcription factor n=1 Tax=Blastococcus sp. Marseille-P5729 TaxID=2086582 RepID=UPI0018FF049B|nr:response regulator transcription factor [Blastococcus sp. Marseille-P5729]